MYQKDYDVEENLKSVERSEYDDTLYVLNHFIKEFNIKDGLVLDLGSGDCHYHKYLKSTVLGIDKKESKEVYDNLIQDIEVFPYDLQNEDPFNFVFSIDVFEHLERPDKVLEYLMQDDHVLNKGGYVFISVPNINTLDDKLNNVNQAIYNPNLKGLTRGRWNSTHLRFFDIESLIRMSESFGYKIKAVTGSNFHTSGMFLQLAEQMQQLNNTNGLDFCNALRNTEFSLFAPNICILIQK